MTKKIVPRKLEYFLKFWKKVQGKKSDSSLKIRMIVNRFLGSRFFVQNFRGIISKNPRKFK